MIKYLKESKPELEKNEDDRKVRNSVEDILSTIKKDGDRAIRIYSEKFDNYSPAVFKLSDKEIQECLTKVPDKDLNDIKFAQEQIKKFAKIQLNSMKEVEEETLPGVILGHKNIPVQSVGCYVPGGKFPMIASAHMSVITASVAGVKRIVASAPPQNGSPHPAIVAAMYLGGAHEIYCLGGIQAVGAMALGTETINPVHMLVGPGNAYVAEAKRQLFGTVGIEGMTAGPSEETVVCDKFSNPEWVASDLIGQAEHDILAQCILISKDKNLLDKVKIEITKQLKEIPRASVARRSLINNGILMYISSDDKITSVVNKIAPEHLELNIKNYKSLVPKIKNSGSICLGKYAVMAMTDYNVGSNHVLPTNGSAKYSSGISVNEFYKRISYINLSKKGIESLGPSVITLANYEGLVGHAQSVVKRIRRK